MLNPRALLLRGTAIAALSLATLAVQAAPILAPWPSPAGPTSASPTGNTGQAGGLTWTLTGWDLSAVGNAYYGVGDYPGGSFSPLGPSLNFGSSPSTSPLAFDAGMSNLAGGIVVWSGFRTLVWHNGSGFVAGSVFNRFTLTVTDLASTPLALLDPTSVGLPASLGGVLDIPGDFKANWLYETDDPTVGGLNWTPSVALFDSLSTLSSHSIYRSVGGAQYYTPAAVPEPGTLVLLGLGVLGAAAIRRRRGA